MTQGLGDTPGWQSHLGAQAAAAQAAPLALEAGLQAAQADAAAAAVLGAQAAGAGAAAQALQGDTGKTWEKMGKMWDNLG